jgi:hypothetical protein
LVFVDAGEDLVMVDDATLSNPVVVLVEEEKFKETLFDVNVSQWLCDKYSFQKVVHIQVDCSAWDH